MELFDLVTLTLCFRRKFLVQESFSQDFGDTDCDFYPWLYYHGTDCGVDRRRRHDGLHDWLEENFQWMTLNKLLAFGGAFFSAFTMFNWWLGYKLFTRSQVIKPKFRLL